MPHGDDVSSSFVGNYSNNSATRDLIQGLLVVAGGDGSGCTVSAGSPILAPSETILLLSASGCTRADKSAIADSLGILGIIESVAVLRHENSSIGPASVPSSLVWIDVQPRVHLSLIQSSSGQRIRIRSLSSVSSNSSNFRVGDNDSDGSSGWDLAHVGIVTYAVVASIFGLVAIIVWLIKRHRRRRLQTDAPHELQASPVNPSTRTHLTLATDASERALNERDDVRELLLYLRSRDYSGYRETDPFKDVNTDYLQIEGDGNPPNSVTSSTDLIETQVRCAICILNFEAGDRVVELPCKHIFHRPCLTKWFIHSKLCPLCKRDAHALVSSIRLPSRSPTPAEPLTMSMPTSVHEIAF